MHADEVGNTGCVERKAPLRGSRSSSGEDTSFQFLRVAAAGVCSGWGVAHERGVAYEGRTERDAAPRRRRFKKNRKMDSSVLFSVVASHESVIEGRQGSDDGGMPSW